MLSTQLVTHRVAKNTIQCVVLDYSSVDVSRRLEGHKIVVDTLQQQSML